MSDLEIIKTITTKYLDTKANRAFIFGSRATGQASKYSDYDLGIDGQKLKSELYFELISAFEESDLHVKVDVVDFNNVSEVFRTNAMQSIIPLTF
ncbi:MAG: nucleotidyltransferase domain-containing protein [bacterium]